MAFPTGAPPADTASDESRLNDLLGADLDAPETETPDGGDTPVTEPEVEVQDEAETEVTQGEEGTEEETEDVSEEEGEGEESGEDDFEESNLETDFSDATYARAAAHWAKRGVTLDPNDQGHRAMLKDWIERGQKISELQSAQPTEEQTEEETTEQPTREPVPAKTPEQMLEERITGVRTYAKETYNPRVAREIVLPALQSIANFFWGKEKAADVLKGRSDEELAEVTQALTSAMSINIADALPQIVESSAQRSKGVMDQSYPYMSKMHEMAEKEAAVDEILEATDSSGAEQYPGFGRMVDSGAINRALASPELKDAMFNKDPYKNRVAKLKIAYKMARNERVDPQALANASRRGRAAEQERQKRVAAGRTSPGSSTRSTTQGRSSFIESLVGNSGSKSAALFKNVGRRQE